MQSLKVESLEFDFLCERRSGLVVLEKLFKQSRFSQPQTDVTLFKSLQRLCLKNLKVSGAAIELLLRNCPVLGALAIHHAQFTSDVEVCGTTNLMLAHLDVYCCKGKNLIKVSAPNLAWIRITKPKDVLLDNVPKLVEANLTYSGRIPVDVQHFAYVLGFSQLKSLELTLHFPELLFANGLPQMPNMKKLAIAYSGMQAHSLLSLTAFLWASPRLQEFKLQLESLMPRNGTESMQAWWNVGQPGHRHLKLFEFRGFNVDDGADMKLVKCILGNCVGLEKIITGGPLIPETSCVPCLEKQVAQWAMARAKERLRPQGVVPQHIQLQFIH